MSEYDDQYDDNLHLIVDLNGTAVKVEVEFDMDENETLFIAKMTANVNGRNMTAWNDATTSEREAAVWAAYRTFGPANLI